MVDSFKSRDVKIGLTEGNIELLSKLIGKTRYGYITIVIQDGVVVQIEKNEKIRIK